MKILYILLVAIFIVNKAFSHDNKEANHEVTESSEILSSGTKSAHLINVATIGMVCDFCAQAIEKVFMKREEIQGIKIDLNNQKVVLFIKEGYLLSDAVILKLFENAGYGVDEIDKSI